MARPDPAAALLPPGSFPSVATKAAWDFARMEEFWELFRPLTPYGKEAKEARAVLADRGSLELLYDRSEAYLAFASRATAGGEASALDRISYHLGRIPRLPDSIFLSGEGAKGAGEAAPLELVEVFLVKKFIANFRALLGLLDGEARVAFGLAFDSLELAARLELGGSDPETFYIADAYDPALRELRSRIAALDAASARLRGEAQARAKEEAGLDFDGRDFLILPHEAAGPLLADRRSASLFAIEPYDSASYLLRIQPSAGELALDAERDLLLSGERALEASVMAGLSRLVRAHAGRLAANFEALREFDLARARALLLQAHGLSRPILAAGQDAALAIEGGRLLPLEADCASSGLRYTPLELGLAEKAAVIFGSNMGGKTVALETVLFLQILAQAGFHVPARRFASRVFPLLHYLGELREADAAAEPKRVSGPSRTSSQNTGSSPNGSSRGLSGFGFEIRSFVEAWEASRSGALLAFDEFARSTGSREAEAILSAVLEALTRRPGCLSLFSTHFHGLSRVEGARFLRMKGLDRRAAGAAFCADEPLSALIKRINGLMEYALVEEGGGEGGSDAIAIAGLLGLDCDIVQRAEGLFGASASTE